MNQGIAKWWIVPAVVLGIMVAVPNVVSADPNDPNDPNGPYWGAEASTFTAEVPSFATNLDFGPHDGGPGIDSAFSTFTDPEGTATADASLSGINGEPLLKALGTGNAGSPPGGGFGTAFGLQEYMHDGPATTLLLSATLTGDLSTPSPNAFDGLRADVLVFQEPNFSYSTDLDTLIGEAGATPYPANEGGDVHINFEVLVDGAVNLNDTRTFEVEDGDTYYLWAKLSATAIGGPSSSGTADAMNTLTINLTELSVIPLPGAAAFGVPVLVGMALRRRRTSR